nr:unnamed protein product [Callosobruchus chinensis]
MVNTTYINGYDIKVTSVKNCENSAIKFNPPITVTADNNCNLFFSGCATVPKQITFAKASYSIRKPPLPDMDGEVDICNAFSAPSIPQITTFLGVFNLPGKCPIPAKKYCADPKKPISISQFRNAIALATGKIHGKIKVKHDGGSSCADLKKFCADGKKPVNIAKYKNGLALILGTTTGKIKLKHDGGPSCVEFTFTTTKSASG